MDGAGHLRLGAIFLLSLRKRAALKIAGEATMILIIVLKISTAFAEEKGKGLPPGDRKERCIFVFASI